jgi:hypothetical protein
MYSWRNRIIAMTTVLEKYVKRKFTSNIKGIVIDDKHCIKYTNKSCVKPKQVAFTIHLPFGLLKSWQEHYKKSVLENYSYVQILNTFIGKIVYFRITTSWLQNLMDFTTSRAFFVSARDHN